MKNKIVKIFVLLFLIGCKSVFSQSSCQNIDFSQGDFTNWKGGVDSVKMFSTYLGCCSKNSFQKGMQTIITKRDTDQFTKCNGKGLVKIPPGEKYSAMINDSIIIFAGNMVANSAQLSYTVNVTNSNSLLIYKYAVVFQDRNHTSLEQPKFEINLVDVNGNILDTACGYYKVIANKNLPDFTTVSCPKSTAFPGNIMWKEWATVGVDLRNYVGQTVTMTFMAADCSQAGHFGYAYINASCHTMSLDIDFCNGRSEAVVVAPPGFTYKWNTGDTTANIKIKNPNLTTTYTCTLTSIKGCSFSLSKTITPTVYHPDFSYVINACGNVNFTNLSTIDQNFIKPKSVWNFGDGTPVDSSDNPTHKFPGDGTYNVSLKVYYMGVCDSTVTKTIVINNSIAPIYTFNNVCIKSPTVKFNNTTTAPAGKSITWFKWDFGDGSPADSTNMSPSHTYSKVDTFDVIFSVKDNTGCSAYKKKQVIIFNYPNAKFTSLSPICVQDNSTVTYSGTFSTGASYNWDFDNAKQTNSNTVGPHTINWTSPGNKKVKLIVTEYGCTSTDSAIIVVNAMPIPNAGKDTSICFGFNTTLTASGGASYLWDNGPTLASQVVSPTVTKTYKVTVTSNGCSDTDDVVVTVNPIPIPVPGPNQKVCDNIKPVKIYASGGTSYLWSSGDLKDTAVVIPPALTNTYNVTVSDKGCTATTFVTIDVFPTTVDAGLDQTICPGSSAELTSTGTPGVTFLWNNAVQGNKNTVNPTNTTTYYVSATNSINCIVVDSVVVNIAVLPAIDFAATPITGCEPLSVSFTDQTNPVGNIYNWDFGDKLSPPSDTTLNNPTHIYMKSGFYNVGLTVISFEKCTVRLTKPNYISVYPNPAASFYSEPVAGKVEEPISFVNNSQNAVKYKWDFGDNTSSETKSPNHVYIINADSSYRVILMVTSKDGCVDSVSNIIKIKKEWYFYIPNAFVPSERGLNKIFIPVGFNYDPNYFEMYIYDRWGMQLFNSNSWEKGWDGKDNKGADAQIGVYVYVISVKEWNGKLHKYIGKVTLLR